MNHVNPIFKAALTVFGTWWVLFTLYAFGGEPLVVLQSLPYIVWSFKFWAVGLILGCGLMSWSIFFRRTRALGGLEGKTHNGLVSSLGPVPRLTSEAARIERPAQRLPIQSKVVQKWIDENKEEFPQHVAMLLAVWDVYSAHKRWPATHRRGGHGGRSLWEHCMAVADKSLTMAPAWVYDGVFVKVRGRSPLKLVSKRNPDYLFDPEDPLIPLIGLAHDIGKIEAYRFNEDDELTTREEGTSSDDDDGGVEHDALGARVLARMPEYWALPANDRRAINLVIGHYHHPSALPLEKSGLSLDDRITALMQFLREADKAVGRDEGRFPIAEANDMSEEDGVKLYEAFVEIVTKYGRINGTGNKNMDTDLKIGQKHDELIVVREFKLRKLLHAKLGMHMEGGEGRYRLTLNLMTILADKGLLYTKHNGIDFGRYVPMYSVSLRSNKSGSQIVQWEPVIIFKPSPRTPELADLAQLSNFGSKMVIDRPLYTHDSNVRNPEVLRELVAKAFNETAADKLRLVSKVDDEETAAVKGPAAPPSASAPAAAAPLPPAGAPVSPPAAPQTVAKAPLPPSAPPVPRPVADAQKNVAPTSPVASSPTPPPSQTVETNAPPWEEPHVEVASIETPLVDESDLHPTDLVDDGLSAVDGEIEIQEGVDQDHELDALFADLPDITEQSEIIAGVHDSAAQARTRSLAEDVVEPPPQLVLDLKPQPPQAPAVALPDRDIPKARPRSAKTEKAAIDALASANAEALFQGIPATKRPERKSGQTDPLAAIRKCIGQNRIPVCGTHEGHAYLLASDVKKALPWIEVDSLIAEMHLPTREASGMLLIGIPD